MRISDWSSDVCSSDLKAALRSRQSSLSKRRRMMKTAIRSAIALAGALLVVSGVPIRAQSSVEDRSPDATRPSPSQDFYCGARKLRSEEHTSELQSLMRISYAVFCLKKKKQTNIIQKTTNIQNKT